MSKPNHVLDVSGLVRPTARLFMTGLALSVASVTWAGLATAQSDEKEPAALVEDINAANVDLEFMDFVYEGMQIVLEDDETLTLSYLRSCTVEEITGGLVKIGRLQSEVSGPVPVVRSAVKCDGGGIVPTERQSEDAAVFVFRNANDDSEEVPVKVYATTPAFVFPKPVEELVITREDQGFREWYRFQVDGRLLDMAKQTEALIPGGLYRAKTVEKSVLFKIAANASTADGPIVKRLIAF